MLGTEAWVVSPGGPFTNKNKKKFLCHYSTTTARLASTSEQHQQVNNVVLTPSEHPDSFDSFKIGSARVHRYSRDEDPDSEIEYVMWYHGRSVTMHTENKSLPPLSTGRIGRATSRNGLIWEKDQEGSVSEDAPDVTLGLNQEHWWSFDVSHIGLGNVLLPMSTPAVLADGGILLMYYHGGNFEETPIADYTEKELPDALKDATMQGMKMRIGVAVSQDGATWGRVEGDHPTGACVVPFDKKDPNSMENAPKNMEEELYCAWPEVAVNLKEADSDSAFLMYYSTMLKDSKDKAIGLATSPDGFRWTKRGICLRPDADSLDAAGCARCCVVRDAIFDEDNGKWEELATWKMYYEGVSPMDNKHRIMVAESRDGREWTKLGVALDVGAEGAWDCGGTGSPHVVR